MTTDDKEPPLSPVQEARTDRAEAVLFDARYTNLANLDAAALILLVEALRAGLDDVLHVLEELTGRPVGTALNKPCS